jgi:hypothetical protein
MRLLFMASAVIFFIGIIYYACHKFDGTLDKIIFDLDRATKGE